jgi:hypothetical protein
MLLFENEKDSVLVTILQNLFTYSNITFPNSDEKDGEYEKLKVKFLEDRKLILDRQFFVKEIEISKSKLDIAKFEESLYDHNILEIARSEKKYFRSFDRQFFVKEIELAKLKLSVAENYQNIFKKLVLKDGCYGCENNRDLFKDHDLEFLRNDLKNLLIESASFHIHSNELEQIKLNNLENDLKEIDNAQKRLDRLNEINDQRIKIFEYQNQLKEKEYWEQKKTSLEVLEVSTY